MGIAKHSFGEDDPNLAGPKGYCTCEQGEQAGSTGGTSVVSRG